MSVCKKIVLLGSGSLYFPRALPYLVMSEEIAGSELVLYDLDQEKSERMAAMGRRLAAEAGQGLRVRATASLADALDGADFAISSIGGSGAEITPDVYSSYYHTVDMRISSKYGVEQVVGDTGGPGGMMMAFRSLPAYLHICREMERRCPRAVLINHSNPMAVLCRAMRKYTSIHVIGICHGVQEGIMHAAKILGLPSQELEATWIGTNHYYWFQTLRHCGEDIYPELRRRLAEEEPHRGTTMTTLLSRLYDYAIVYPEDDHVVEFYPFLAQVKNGQAGLPYALVERAKYFGNEPAKPMPSLEPPSEEGRAQFFTNYQQILDATKLPPERDNSVTGEGIGRLVGAIATGARYVFIANLPNQGSIPNLPATALVEVEAVTDSQGARPIHMGEAPLMLKGILEKRFVWQELVADAAVTGDRKTALQAMMMDEMAIWPDQAEAMLDELLTASKPLLPQFFGGVKAG